MCIRDSDDWTAAAAAGEYDVRIDSEDYDADDCGSDWDVAGTAAAAAAVGKCWGRTSDAVVVVDGWSA